MCELGLTIIFSTLGEHREPSHEGYKSIYEHVSNTSFSLCSVVHVWRRPWYSVGPIYSPLNENVLHIDKDATLLESFFSYTMWSLVLHAYIAIITETFIHILESSPGVHPTWNHQQECMPSLETLLGVLFTCG